MESAVCPITGEPAETEKRSGGDWTAYFCPAAGGKYVITGSAEEEIASRQMSPADRARLVTWLVEQRRAGVRRPSITTEQLDLEKLPRRMPVARRVERLYRYLQTHLQSLDATLPYTFTNSALGLSQGGQATRAYLRAWTESVSDLELVALVGYATAEGYVRTPGTGIGLTVSGWQHLEKLDEAGAAFDQCFVAMWFDESMSAAYRDGIDPAIRAAGYLPMRIDRKEHNNKIDDEIIAEIRRSRFIVADFTCGVFEGPDGRAVEISRGGVYYEAGFAQGLGLQVIWTCRQDHIGLVHFDTRQFNHIAWSSPDELRERLTVRIRAVLGEGPHRARGA